MDMNSDIPVFGLYGGHLKRSKACGYCYLHKCHLTVKTMKKHKCLQKQCECLKKNEEHAYWIQKAYIKEQKKLKKQQSQE